jgi:hypothetical protein
MVDLRFMIVILSQFIGSSSQPAAGREPSSIEGPGP